MSSFPHSISELYITTLLLASIVLFLLMIHYGNKRVYLNPAAIKEILLNNDGLLHFGDGGMIAIKEYLFHTKRHREAGVPCGVSIVVSFNGEPVEKVDLITDGPNSRSMIITFSKPHRKLIEKILKEHTKQKGG